MTESTGANRGSDAAGSADPGPRPRRPWWIPPFLGRMPQGLDDRYVPVVGIVSLAFLFENYDVSMLSAALKQIRESYGLGTSEMSELLAWIRLGAIPAFPLLPLADRLGRRRVFLVAIAGMSVGTFVSGLAQTPLQFVVAQTVTRSFLVAATATAVVLVAFAAFPLVAFAMYFGPAWAVPFVWMPFVFLLTGGNVLMRIITSELFPTSSRNTAMGWETLMETLGAALGFAAVGWLASEMDGLAQAAVAVSCVSVLGAFVVWQFPETAGRELESGVEPAVETTTH